ncbi:MAG TPA: hypothetical protein VGE16_08680 [Albitalea sp.]
MTETGAGAAASIAYRFHHMERPGGLLNSAAHPDVDLSGRALEFNALVE